MINVLRTKILKNIQKCFKSFFKQVAQDVSSVLRYSWTKHFLNQMRFFCSKKSLWKLLKCSFYLAEWIHTGETISGILTLENQRWKLTSMQESSFSILIFIILIFDSFFDSFFDWLSQYQYAIASNDLYHTTGKHERLQKNR